MTLSVANVTTLGTVAYASTGNSAITYMTFCNYSAGNVTASVYLVPNGQSLGNTNIILQNLLITPGDTYQLYQAAEKLLLGNGDSVQVVANANSSITTAVTYTTI